MQGRPIFPHVNILSHAAPFFFNYRLARIVLSVLLAGCASLPETTQVGPPTDGFELIGRVAVRHGDEGTSGRIVWRHGPDFDEMLIASVLGQGIARITRRHGSVELVTADHGEYQAAEAESLTERVLGWRLPLGGLPDWVQGRPDPAYPAMLVRDAQSRLSELEQNGWRIRYQEYQGARPLRLQMSHNDLEIRLIVDKWTGSR